MARYKVPQKIDLPDKLVGPLTLIQFAYLLIGGIIVFAIFKNGNWLLIVLVGLPIALLTLAFAFIQVQNQSFGKFLLNLIIFALSPKARVWHHGKTNLAVPNQPNRSSSPHQQTKINPKPLNREKLTRISRQLDQS